MLAAASLAAISFVTAGCGGSADRSTSTTTTAKSAPTTTVATSEATSSKPAVGDCLEPMTQPIANSAQLPAIVPCDGPHGGEIVSVLEIPEPSGDLYPAWGRSLEGADKQVAACSGSSSEPGDIATFLGSSPLTLPDSARSQGAADAYAVSGIQYAFFVPGPAAWLAGQRWFACSAVLNNQQKVLSSYTGSMKGALAKPGSLDVQLSWCKQQPAGSRETYTVVPCSESHNYEQLASFTAGSADATYPGDEALGALASAACPDLSSQATGKRSDQLVDGLGLGWTYPLDTEWASGDRSIRCFAVTPGGESTGAVSSGTAELAGG